MNISSFCWKFERRSAQKIDLVLHCAPGMAKLLAAALPAEWGFKTRGKAKVRSCRPVGVRAALLALEPGDGELAALLDEYVLRCAGLAKGVSPSEEARNALRAIVWSLATYGAAQP
jgi:hypothetical protein